MECPIAPGSTQVARKPDYSEHIPVRTHTLIELPAKLLNDFLTIMYDQHTKGGAVRTKRRELGWQS